MTNNYVFIVDSKEDFVRYVNKLNSGVSWLQDEEKLRQMYSPYRDKNKDNGFFWYWSSTMPNCFYSQCYNYKRFLRYNPSYKLITKEMGKLQ